MDKKHDHQHHHHHQHPPTVAYTASSTTTTTHTLAKTITPGPHPPPPKSKVDWNEALKHMVIEDAPKTSLDNLRRLISEAVLKERVERVRQAEKVKLPPPLCCISRKRSPALSSQIMLTNADHVNASNAILKQSVAATTDEPLPYYDAPSLHANRTTPVHNNAATLDDIVNHIDVDGQIMLEAEEQAARFPRHRPSGWLKHRHVRHSLLPHHHHHPQIRELDIDPLDVAFHTKRVRHLLAKHDKLQKRIKNAVVQQYARYNDRVMLEQQRNEERHRQRIAETVQQQYADDMHRNSLHRIHGGGGHRSHSRHARSEDDLLTRTRSRATTGNPKKTVLPDIVQGATTANITSKVALGNKHSRLSAESKVKAVQKPTVNLAVPSRAVSANRSQTAEIFQSPHPSTFAAAFDNNPKSVSRASSTSYYPPAQSSFKEEPPVSIKLRSLSSSASRKRLKRYYSKPHLSVKPTVSKQTVYFDTNSEHPSLSSVTFTSAPRPPPPLPVKLPVGKPLPDSSAEKPPLAIVEKSQITPAVHSPEEITSHPSEYSGLFSNTTLNESANSRSKRLRWKKSKHKHDFQRQSLRRRTQRKKSRIRRHSTRRRRRRASDSSSVKSTTSSASSRKSVRTNRSRSDVSGHTQRSRMNKQLSFFNKKGRGGDTLEELPATTEDEHEESERVITTKNHRRIREKITRTRHYSVHRVDTQGNILPDDDDEQDRKAKAITSTKSFDLVAASKDSELGGGFKFRRRKKKAGSGEEDESETQVSGGDKPKPGKLKALSRSISRKNQREKNASRADKNQNKVDVRVSYTTTNDVDPSAQPSEATLAERSSIERVKASGEQRKPSSYEAKNISRAKPGGDEDQNEPERKKGFRRFSRKRPQQQPPPDEVESLEEAAEQPRKKAGLAESLVGIKRRVQRTKSDAPPHSPLPSEDVDVVEIAAGKKNRWASSLRRKQTPQPIDSEPSSTVRDEPEENQPSVTGFGGKVRVKAKRSLKTLLRREGSITRADETAHVLTVDESGENAITPKRSTNERPSAIDKNKSETTKRSSNESAPKDEAENVEDDDDDQRDRSRDGRGRRFSRKLRSVISRENRGGASKNKSIERQQPSKDVTPNRSSGKNADNSDAQQVVVETSQTMVVDSTTSNGEIVKGKAVRRQSKITRVLLRRRPPPTTDDDNDLQIADTKPSETSAAQVTDSSMAVETASVPTKSRLKFLRTKLQNNRRSNQDDDENLLQTDEPESARGGTNDWTPPGGPDHQQRGYKKAARHLPFLAKKSGSRAQIAKDEEAEEDETETEAKQKRLSWGEHGQSSSARDRNRTQSLVKRTKNAAKSAAHQPTAMMKRMHVKKTASDPVVDDYGENELELQNERLSTAVRASASGVSHYYTPHICTDADFAACPRQPASRRTGSRHRLGQLLPNKIRNFRPNAYDRSLQQQQQPPENESLGAGDDDGVEDQRKMPLDRGKSQDERHQRHYPGASTAANAYKKFPRIYHRSKSRTDVAAEDENGAEEEANQEQVVEEEEAVEAQPQITYPKSTARLHNYVPHAPNLKQWRRSLSRKGRKHPDEEEDEQTADEQEVKPVSSLLPLDDEPTVQPTPSKSSRYRLPHAPHISRPHFSRHRKQRDQQTAEAEADDVDEYGKVSACLPDDQHIVEEMSEDVTVDIEENNRGQSVSRKEKARRLLHKTPSLHVPRPKMPHMLHRRDDNATPSDYGQIIPSPNSSADQFPHVVDGIRTTTTIRKYTMPKVRRLTLPHLRNRGDHKHQRDIENAEAQQDDESVQMQPEGSMTMLNDGDVPRPPSSAKNKGAYFKSHMPNMPHMPRVPQPHMPNVHMPVHVPQPRMPNIPHMPMPHKPHVPHMNVPRVVPHMPKHIPFRSHGGRNQTAEEEEQAVEEEVAAIQQQEELRQSSAAQHNSDRWSARPGSDRPTLNATSSRSRLMAKVSAAGKASSSLLNPRNLRKSRSRSNAGSPSRNSDRVSADDAFTHESFRLDERKSSNTRDDNRKMSERTNRQTQIAKAGRSSGLIPRWLQNGFALLSDMPLIVIAELVFVAVVFSLLYYMFVWQSGVARRASGSPPGGGIFDKYLSLLGSLHVGWVLCYVLHFFGFL